MKNDPTAKEAAREYARGYASGRKRTESDLVALAKLSDRQDFLERAFLVSLHPLVDSTGWKTGDVPLTTAAQKVKLAWDFAEAALRQMRYAK